MKTIRTFWNLAEAGFASSLLEASGINASLADEQSFTIGYGQALGGLRLQVEDADVERALHILDQGPDAVVDKPQALESSVEGPSRIPIGVFVAGGVAFGLLAFAGHQAVENRRSESSGSAEQRYEYDYNHDGRPESFYITRHNQLFRTETDRNSDGKIDAWEFYDDESRIQRAESDDNFDGQVDAWFAYKNGFVVSSKSDTDFNGRADLFAAYEYGIISRAEVIPNETGKVTKRYIYKDGVESEEWVDENGDGVFDYKILHDPFGGMSEHIPVNQAK